MNTYSPDDILTFPRVDGIRICPSGDYSSVKTFGNGPFRFEDNCTFSRCTEFLSVSEFGNNCDFANFCFFLRPCKFGNNCAFGKSTIFERRPEFGLNVTLGPKSRVVKEFSD